MDTLKNTSSFLENAEKRLEENRFKFPTDTTRHSCRKCGSTYIISLGEFSESGLTFALAKCCICGHSYNVLKQIKTSL